MEGLNRKKKNLESVQPFLNYIVRSPHQLPC